MKIPEQGAGNFQWADYYRSLGCSVIPLREGKLPAVQWKEFQSRAADRRELGNWFITHQMWGVAIVCGAVSGNLCRLDFDDPADYEILCDKIEPGPTFRSQRQGGGWGVLYRSTSPMPTLPQKTFKDYPKLEVRGEGSITVVPPTTGYDWTVSPGNELPLVDVPDMLTRLFGFDPRNKGRLVDSVERTASDELTTLLRETQEGERSNNLVKIAGILRARGLDLETSLDVMEHNFEEHWPHDGMDWDEAKDTFERAWRRYEHEGVRVTGSGPTVLSLGDLDEDDKPRIQFKRLDEIRPLAESDVLIPNVVLSGVNGNTLIAAATKIGKTSLVTDAAVTASRGDKVWGYYTVPKPLRIAIVDQEQKYEQIRANQILMTPVIGEPNYDNLYLAWDEGGQFDIQHPDGLDLLYRKLYAFQPDLVVIDGWGWFVGHQASDPKLVKPALTWLKRLRQSLGCATIIIHHFKKDQFAGRAADHGQFVDWLDKIEGLKRLSDQAHTVLGYNPIGGYDTFNILDGRSNYTKWDPPKTIIDYDHTSVTHHVVDAEEGAMLFDPETYRLLWGVSAESKATKDKIRVIMGRMQMTRNDIADALGVHKSMVSRWYSGQKNPSSENAEKLDELYKKAKGRPLKAGGMPVPGRKANEPA